MFLVFFGNRSTSPPITPIVSGGGKSWRYMPRRRVRELLDEEEDLVPPPPAPETKRVLEKGLLADLLDEMRPATVRYVKREVAKFYVPGVTWGELQAGYDRTARQLQQDDDEDAILLLI